MACRPTAADAAGAPGDAWLTAGAVGGGATAVGAGADSIFLSRSLRLLMDFS